MDMYIRMYDELKRSEDDNPTLGIVLCTETDEDIARYSVMHGSEQLFASKYKLYLPTEEELRAEIESQKAILRCSRRQFEFIFGRLVIMLLCRIFLFARKIQEKFFQHFALMIRYISVRRSNS